MIDFINNNNENNNGKSSQILIFNHQQNVMKTVPENIEKKI